MDEFDLYSDLDYDVLVDSPEIAIYYANKIWRSKGFVPRKPQLVFYDEQENIWLIRDTLPIYMVGGNHYVLISRSGRVIAVWATA